MKKKVPVAALKMGVFIEALDRPWLETPFLLQGFFLNSKEDLEQLKAYCDYVFIDTDRGVDVDAGQPLAKVDKQLEAELIHYLSIDPPAWDSLPKHEPRDNRDTVYSWIKSMRREAVYPEVPETALEEEITRARETHETAEKAIDSILGDVAIGNTLQTAEAKQVVKDMVESVIRNPAALLCLTQLRIKDPYTATHSIDVCILAMTFGRFLGMPPQQLQMLGLGALLHDVGKVQIEDDILNKPGRYSPEEYELMKQHTVRGRDILADGHLPREAVEIAYAHHERWDGSGYPEGLQGRQLGALSMITAIADVYSALTATRPYRGAMRPFDVLKRMYEWRSKDFNDTLVEEFIRCIGIYPIGSLVELSSGEVGVVLSVNPRWHLKPTVVLLLDPDKQPYQQRRIVDLLSESDPATGKPLDVRHVVSPEDYGIDEEDYLDLFLALGQAAPRELTIS